MVNITIHGASGLNYLEMKSLWQAAGIFQLHLDTPDGFWSRRSRPDPLGSPKMGQQGSRPDVNVHDLRHRPSRGSQEFPNTSMTKFVTESTSESSTKHVTYVFIYNIIMYMCIYVYPSTYVQIIVYICVYVHYMYSTGAVFFSDLPAYPRWMFPPRHYEPPMTWQILPSRFLLPSGYVKIAIENGHRNSGFSH